MAAEKKKYGKYDVVGKLGIGGMGVVYKGYDSLINRHVAIKTMTIDKGVDENLKKRFYREAQSAGILNHANIVTIFDMDEEEGQPYIAMELLSGVDLKEIISKRMPITLEKKVDIIAQACDGLDYAHKHGVIHRDIKPGNIRVLDNGLVKILDFGIARIESSELTKTGMVMGTVSYMSPEQIAGKRVDGRSDIFSIGVVFYELMTGRKPFPGEAITTIIYKIMNEAPDALRKADATVLPAPVEKIINTALAKDANKRYANAGLMSEDLRAFLATLTTQDTTMPEMDGATLMAGKTIAAKLVLPAPPPASPAQKIAPTKPPAPPSRPVPAPPPPRPAPPVVPPSMPLMPTRDIERTLPPSDRKAAASPPSPPLASPAVKTVTPPTARPAEKSLGLDPANVDLGGRSATTARPAPKPLEEKRPAPGPPAKPVAPKPLVSRPVVSAPPSLRDLGEAEVERPARSPVPIVAGILGVAAIAVLGYFFLFRDRTGTDVTVRGNGTVSLDVRPWAKVAEVIDVGTKAKVDVGSPTTPCRIELPAGKYEITVVNESFGQPQKLTVDVKPNGSELVSRDLPGFDVEQVLKGL